jgi:hypothetical protein
MYHDVVVLPGKRPLISSGPPGRSALSGSTVTVLGCTGFLGRYLVSKIGSSMVFPALHATAHSEPQRRAARRSLFPSATRTPLVT